MTPPEAAALALLQPLESAGKLSSPGAAATLASWIDDDDDPQEAWTMIRSHLDGMALLRDHGRPQPEGLPTVGDGFALAELPETLPEPEPPPLLPEPPAPGWREALFAPPIRTTKRFR